MSATQDVAFRFQLSDRTLFSIRRRLVVRSYSLDEALAGDPDALHPPDDCMGMMLRSVPVTKVKVGITTIELGSRWLRYVMQRFPRFYVDMGQEFEDYKTKFSGKTRSTLSRKVKKFAERNGGKIRWERIARPEEVGRFLGLARQVSAKTYQERLLDAGLPDDPVFAEEAKCLAEADCLRAYLLFDDDRPVSYLFCPIQHGIVVYAYLGYDPEYRRHSVGTVLQWLAMESLFAERRFRCFDFTEGESEHKRVFATGHIECANVALLRRTLANRMLVHSHFWFAQLVEALGNWLEAHDLKTHIRSWLRFGRGSSQ